LDGSVAVELCARYGNYGNACMFLMMSCKRQMPPGKKYYLKNQNYVIERFGKIYE
jgi:hypothetical protein